MEKTGRGREREKTVIGDEILFTNDVLLQPLLCSLGCGDEGCYGVLWPHSLLLVVWCIRLLPSPLILLYYFPTLRSTVILGANLPGYDDVM